MNFLKKSARKVKRFLETRQRQKQGLEFLSKCLDEGLPTAFEAGLRSMIAGESPSDSVAAFEKVESIRQAIAARGQEQIPVYYSPKPAAEGETMTDPGERKSFTAEHLALNTSAPSNVGKMIHLFSKGFSSKTTIEFGSCVGIGASYLAASPSCERMITIEASKDLADIARNSVQQVKPDAEVYNEFFDDALDHLLPTFENGIDFAWIDGHHEKTATIHYFERIKPHLNENSLVAFDDIYWSQDMLDGWHHLQKTVGVSHSLDIGYVGVCQWVGGDEIPEQWDFKKFAGNGVWVPQKPAGW